MAKGAYIGSSSTARRVKKIYIGQNGVAKRVKKAYIGVNGVAKLFYATGGKILITRQNPRSFGYFFDTSDKSWESASYTFTTGKAIPFQYANGKWIMACDAQATSSTSFGRAFIVLKDEKTLVETSIDLGWGYQPIGLAVDDTNIYVFVCSGYSTDFKTISLATLTVTSTVNVGSYILIGPQAYPTNPWNICSILSNGKLIVANRCGANAPIVYAYDKANNTFTQIHSVTGGCIVHNRAISGSRAGFRSNNVLCTTDGNTRIQVTTGQTRQDVNNNMAYGGGRWVATYSSRYTYVSTDDGATWTASSQQTYTTVSITFADGLFYAIAIDNSNTYLVSSPDGFTWTVERTIANTTSNYSQYDLCFSTLHGVGNA